MSLSSNLNSAVKGTILTYSAIVQALQRAVHLAGTRKRPQVIVTSKPFPIVMSTFSAAEMDMENCWRKSIPELISQYWYLLIF